jgi:hypothetical protein
MPAFTWIDAVTQGIAGFVYLAVGLAAWRRAPRDARTQVFLGLALANLVTFEVPAAAWLAGIADITMLPRGVFLALFVAMATGAILLFHFCQVFPWRRPWIERWGKTLAAAYAIAPLATAALVVSAPASVSEISYAYAAAILGVGVPLVLVLTVALPVGAVVSLVKSYRDARGPDRPMRTPLAWLLVSQIAGGTIALIFAPVLATVVPGDAPRLALTLVSWVFGLMTPFAFALGMARLNESAAAGAPASGRA